MGKISCMSTSCVQLCPIKNGIFATSIKISLQILRVDSIKNVGDKVADF